MKRLFAIIALMFMIAASASNPLDIKIWLSDQADPASGVLKINCAVASSVPVSSMKIYCNAVLAGSIEKPSEILIEDFEKFHSRPLHFNLRLASGKSYVVVSASAFDAKGKLMFGKNKKLYIIWDNIKLYYGSKGFGPLVDEKLNNELKEGKITREQMENAKKNLMQNTGGR